MKRPAHRSPSSPRIPLLAAGLLAYALAAAPLSASLPEPDHTIYGTPRIDGAVATAGTVTLLGDPDHIEVTDLGGPLTAAELRGVVAEAYQVAAWPGLVDALDDADLDDLDGSGLPFAPPGDLTAAFFWTSPLLAAGESHTVRSVLAAGGAAAVPEVDLSLTKTDGLAAAVPGETVAYTVTVDNGGPATAFDARVSDDLPAALLGVAWTCAAAGGAVCTAAGAGDLEDAVLMPAGGQLVYTLTGTIDPAASGTLTNTAAVTAPAGVTDSDPGDNADTDVDVLTPVADLAITKDDGVTSVVPGESVVTYVIVVTNAGPSSVAGAVVADLFPPELEAVTWTCSASPGAWCPASGAGDLDQAVDLPAGGTVTFTATGTVDPGATGSLVDVAAIVVPAGTIETDPANNSAADTDALTPRADLEITVDADREAAYPGATLAYEIAVQNHGPSDADGSHVRDLFPPELIGVIWACEPTAGASCTSDGSGDIDETVLLGAGASILYLVEATLDPAAVGPVVNTATVTTPPSVTETDPGDNSDAATVSLWLFADGFESGDVSQWSPVGVIRR